MLCGHPFSRNYLKHHRNSIETSTSGRMATASSSGCIAHPREGQLTKLPDQRDSMADIFDPIGARPA
jgi:hypothetical protein